MLIVPERLLHGPGPSPVAPSVLEALGKPCIGHMDPAFMEIMNRVREMLQIPPNWAVAAIMPLGKPVKQLTRLKRKPVEDILVHDCWPLDNT